MATVFCKMIGVSRESSLLYFGGWGEPPTHTLKMHSCRGDRSPVMASVRPSYVDVKTKLLSHVTQTWGSCLCVH